ncbi:hypothetical protein SLEP1_g34866 [Rubroshorea leprosula]|uniref:Uncharacterized protein n=1 Tax=Rubroshorea leprosula TaxID=152421 RepID=A0AAV5KLP5_9ROSI|nr:hypothetical protein SLEP1_g34866 [Rubroshorea leprosula]
MDFFRELRELRGNQGGEEEEGVIAAEPIVMIVPSCLQDLPETMTPESSAGSSAGDNGDGHHASPSSSSPSGDSSNHEKEPENVGGNEQGLPAAGEWENKGGASSRSSGQRALNKWVQEAGGDDKGIPNPQDNIGANWWAEREGLLGIADGLDTCVCRSFRRWSAISLARTGIRPACRLRAAFDAADAQQHQVHRGLYAVVCETRGTSQGDSVQVAVPVPVVSDAKGEKWYYLSRRDKSQLFKNVRNKVARWKMQFIFFRDTRTERVSNDLTARLAEWRTPNAHVNYPQLLPRDTDLKKRLRNEQHSRTPTSTSTELPRPRAEQHHIETDAVRRATASRASIAQLVPSRVARPATVRSPNAPSVIARDAIEPGSASASMLGPRIAYPEGFSYVRAECQPAMVQAMHSFVPPADSRRAKAFVLTIVAVWQAFSYAIALYESEQEARSQNGELGSKCKQLAAEKASLVDDLREELEHARAEKESRIQVAKDEAARIEERAKKAEADRDRAQHELSSLRHQVAEVDRNLTATGEALNELKTSHARSVSIARAQGAEWFVGSATFQDAVAVASANVTMEIYNEIRGKVLQHCPDFPIGELVFVDGEDLNKQKKSLAPLVDATDPTGLPSFDAWVEGAPVAEQEPSSTPPNSQPAVVPASSPVSAPASEPADRSTPARSPAAAADASMPVDLTDD